MLRIFELDAMSSVSQGASYVAPSTTGNDKTVVESNGNNDGFSDQQMPDDEVNPVTEEFCQSAGNAGVSEMLDSFVANTVFSSSESTFIGCETSYPSVRDLESLDTQATVYENEGNSDAYTWDATIDINGVNEGWLGYHPDELAQGSVEADGWTLRFAQPSQIQASTINSDWEITLEEAQIIQAQLTTGIVNSDGLSANAIYFRDDVLLPILQDDTQALVINVMPASDYGGNLGRVTVTQE